MVPKMFEPLKYRDSSSAYNFFMFDTIQCCIIRSISSSDQLAKLPIWLQGQTCLLLLFVIVEAFNEKWISNTYAHMMKTFPF